MNADPDLDAALAGVRSVLRAQLAVVAVWSAREPAPDERPGEPGAPDELVGARAPVAAGIAEMEVAGVDRTARRHATPAAGSADPVFAPRSGRTSDMPAPSGDRTASSRGEHGEAWPAAPAELRAASPPGIAALPIVTAPRASTSVGSVPAERPDRSTAPRLPSLVAASTDSGTAAALPSPVTAWPEMRPEIRPEIRPETRPASRPMAAPRGGTGLGSDAPPAASVSRSIEPGAGGAGPERRRMRERAGRASLAVTPSARVAGLAAGTSEPVASLVEPARPRAAMPAAARDLVDLTAEPVQPRPGAAMSGLDLERALEDLLERAVLEGGVDLP